jgi:hypothetical protein
VPSEYRGYNPTISIQLLGTAWTVWKMARKRVGPVRALIVTVAILGGIKYLKPRVAAKFPSLATVVTETNREISLGSSDAS